MTIEERINELGEKYEKQKEINKELVDENEALKFAARMSEKIEKQLRKENAELREKYLQATDEGTSFAHLKSLERENTKLKQQIEKMKCCCNCKYLKSLAYGEFSCDLYGECKHYSKWEIKEND